MKKLFTILALFVAAISANAQITGSVVIPDMTVQCGSTVELPICLTNSDGIEGFKFNLAYDEQITINKDETGEIAISSTKGYTATGVVKSETLIGLGAMTSSIMAAGTNVEVATLSITAPEAAGEYKLTISDVVFEKDGVITIDGTHEVTLTVQRAATVDGLPEGYALEVIPFNAVEGENSMNILFKAPEVIKDLEFDITLPKGMFLYDGNFESTLPVAVEAAQAVPASNTVSISAEGEQTAHVKIAGNKLKKSGMAASSDLVTAFTLTSLVFDDATVDELELGDSYKYVHNSIQNLSISNIKMGNVAGSTTYTGKEYVASVFFGTPAETDPIVYGHYTADGVKALKSVKAARTIDMTSAIVEKGVSDAATIAAAIEGTLIQGAEQTAYKRTNATYSTLCLPYEIDATAGEYYTVESIDTKSITIKEATGKIAANTPVIFKGTVAPAANVSVYPGTAGTVETGASTFTGTYETVDLKAGEGYYISGGKFYGDGAEVAPFRAYFAGAIAGVKNLSILIDTEDGLIDITDQLSNEDIYDLAGRKLDKTRKGVNIIGGKKVLVK